MNRFPAILLALVGTAVVGASAGFVLFRPSEDPTVPAARQKDYPWMSRAEWRRRHQQTRRAAHRVQAQLVFLGDSIFEGWDADVYAERFAPHHALNLGIGGDQTQHLLFRLKDGALDGVNARVAVILIGTNNFGHSRATGHEVAQGVQAVVRDTLARLPQGKILLLGILPCDEAPTSSVRTRIAEANSELARLDDGRRVRYLDVGNRFLRPDGTIPRELMADFLHPTAEGYRVLADAMQPLLDELVGADASGSPGWETPTPD